MKELFPGGKIDGQLPLLKKEVDQAWTLNSLANSFAVSGQPAQAVSLFLFKNKLNEKNDDKKNLAIGLGNAAQHQLLIGQLSSGAGHLRKRIDFCGEIKDEFYEAVERKELGRILVFQGRANAEEELASAMEIFKKYNTNFKSVCTSYYSLSALLQARLAAVLPAKENIFQERSREALRQARQALKFAEETIKTRYAIPRDFVQAYWLLETYLVSANVGQLSRKTSQEDKYEYRKNLYPG